MKTIPFPTDLLKVSYGSFKLRSNFWYLELNFHTFDLPNEHTDEFSDSYKDIETNFRIDFVETGFKDICGKCVEFESPNNTIDGSVYIGHAHHPVDVIKIDGTQLPQKKKKPGFLNFDAVICFQFEGLEYSEGVEFADTPCSFNLKLIPTKGGWDIEPTQLV